MVEQPAEAAEVPQERVSRPVIQAAPLSPQPKASEPAQGEDEPTSSS